VEGKMFLCLIKDHAMKTKRGVHVKIHAFLTSALAGGAVSPSCPGFFTAWGTAHSNRWTGRLDGPRLGLDTRMKRHIPCHCLA